MRTCSSFVLLVGHYQTHEVRTGVCSGDFPEDFSLDFGCLNDLHTSDILHLEKKRDMHAVGNVTNCPC